MKTQLGHAAPAEDLFASPLFRRRRHYAEGSGLPWFVLSSRHGLLRPDDLAQPYDLPLARQPLRYRLDWAQTVAGQLERALGALAGRVFEVHAGAAHVEPIEAALAGRNATVVAPLRGLTQGGHLAWYAARRSDLESGGVLRH